MRSHTNIKKLVQRRPKGRNTSQENPFHLVIHFTPILGCTRSIFVFFIDLFSKAYFMYPSNDPLLLILSSWFLYIIINTIQLDCLFVFPDVITAVILTYDNIDYKYIY